VHQVRAAAEHSSTSATQISGANRDLSSRGDTMASIVGVGVGGDAERSRGAAARFRTAQA